MLGQTVYENSFSAIVERVFVNIPNLSKGLYNLSVVINDKDGCKEIHYWWVVGYYSKTP